jgi:hypothetical protein
VGEDGARPFGVGPAGWACSPRSQLANQAHSSTCQLL